MDDMALLREYATRNSEAAFEELVSRRAGFVYSAALRQVRDPHLAEEITQAVFIILAQKAGRISDETNLIGWLFKTTRFAALAQMRAAAKRQRREQEVFMQSELQSTAPDPLWEQMSPLLDEALTTLGEKDRQAVLLRFFENKSLAEVGNNLGAGEDTARKRVSRALEKLRKFFFKRGVVSTTTIIAGAISANSIQAAPAMLAKSVTAVAIAKGAAANGSTLTLIKGALKLMAWTKAKTAIMTGVVVLLTIGTTTFIVQRTLEPTINDSFFTFTLPQSPSDMKNANLRNAWSKKLADAPPIVLVRATHFPNLPPFDGVTYDKRIRMVGRNVPFEMVMRIACVTNWDDYPATRMVFPTNMPSGNFDFLVTIPDQARKRFQDEIEKQFGLVGHVKMHDTDVLLLKIKTNNPSGLKPTSGKDAEQGYFGGHYVVVNLKISDWIWFLNKELNQPVFDQTGLTNKYDFDLQWQRDGPASLKKALLDQLGLELVPTNMPIKMLVVEKVK